MTEHRRTQAERAAASDSAIYKAAIELIASEGPKNMTLAKVGKTAGYTGGLVSYRFGSKEGLLKAVSERIVELWNAKTLQAPKVLKAQGVERLKLIACDYIESVRAGSPMLLALHRLLNASFSSCPYLLPYFQAFDANVRASVASTLTEHEQLSPDFDADAFAVIYISTLRGVAQQYFINQSDVDLDTAKQMVWTLCDELVEH